MADRKISQLAQLQTAEDQDYLPIVDNSEGETKRILVGNLLTDQLTPAERTKLQGIAEGATANQTDAHLLNRANHTGTQTSATISDFNSSVDSRISGSSDAGHGTGSVTLHNDVTSAGSGAIITAGERTKLSGIETGATANSSDANLKNRANHTGTQANTTITGLGTASTKNVGTSANQVVQLDAQSKLPAVDGSQLTNIALVLSQ